MIGNVFDIKEMAVHDGPGLRTTVFLKGCPLRCVWCHNPEGLTPKPQLMYKDARCRKCGQCMISCDHPECSPYGRCIYMCPENCLEVVGREVDAKKLAVEIKQTALVLGDHFGGFTFSGGEPLAQADFVLEVIRYLPGYHFAIETSGFANEEIFQRVLEKLDYVIMDLKLADDSLHRKYTGVSNVPILRNLEILRNSGKPCCIRTPLIPGITDTDENLTAIKQLVFDMEHELLPYNPIGEAKYKMLGLSYPFKELF